MKAPILSSSPLPRPVSSAPLSSVIATSAKVALALSASALAGAMIGSGNLVLRLSVPAALIATAAMVYPSSAIALLAMHWPVDSLLAVQVGPVNLRPYNTLPVLLLLQALFVYQTKRASLLPNLKPFFPAAVYLAGIVVTLPFSSAYDLSIKGTEVLIFQVLLMLAICAQTRTVTSWDRLVLLLTVGSVIHAALILLNTFLIMAHQPVLFPEVHQAIIPGGRPIGFFGEPDRAAEFHATIALLVLPLALEKWAGRELDSLLARHRSFFRFAFVLNVYVVAVGIFRAAWVSLLVGVIVYTILGVLHHRRVVITGWLTIAGVGGMALVIGGLFLGESLIPYVTSRWQIGTILQPEFVLGQRDFQVQNEVILWSGFLKSPYVGNGLASFSYVNPETLERQADPSVSLELGTNRPLGLLYSVGLIGFGGYLVWQLSLARKIVASPAHFARKAACLLPLTGIFWGHDWFRAVLTFNMIYMIFGLAMALEATVHSPTNPTGLSSPL